jgi:hypothetical protein
MSGQYWPRSPDGLPLGGSLDPEAHMNDAPAAPATRSSRFGAWLLFLAGVGLFVLGPAAYVLQFRLKNLGTPWYLPLMATVGVALAGLSLRRRGGIVRAILLVPLILVCGFEWFAIGIASRSPAYAGPATPGNKVPGFTAHLADGTTFTEADLVRGSPSVLLFFRGRW